MEEMKEEEEEKPYRCEQCQGQFTTRSHLTAHHKYKHGEGVYECRFCTERYPQSQTLTRHLKMIHSAEMAIPQKDASTQTGWEHGREISWICFYMKPDGTQCGQIFPFSNFDGYDVHIQEHQTTFDTPTQVLEEQFGKINH